MRGRLWFGAATAALLMASGTPAWAQDADQGGDASTQARFSTGQTVEGEISPAGDLDWFRMRVERGQRYTFTLNGVPGAEGAALDPMLGIYDAQGNQLAFNDDANGLNSELSHTPSVSGDIFIEARAFSEQATGRYALNATAAQAPADDAGNDASTRRRASVGRATNGSIEYEGDVDWYRLSARTGQRYTITLTGGEGEGALGDPLLRVLDREGVELAANDDSGGTLNSSLEFTPRASGEVFIEARGYGDRVSGAYTLNVAAARLPSDAVSADRYTRGRAILGQSVAGSIDFGGDTDWYRVRLTAGETYRFGLASSGETPLNDPFLKVLGPDGAELAFDDDGGEGLNSYVEFTAATTGNYFVEAGAFGDEGEGAYALSALAGGIPADASTDAAMSAEGDYRDGVLDPANDRDWYKLNLAEGQAVRVSLESSQTGDPLADPYLVLYGPDGAELARDDDGGSGLNAFIEYQAPAAGAYFVEARGFSEDARGRYLLSVIGGEIGQSLDAADHVMPGAEGRTSIIGAPGDADWFAVEVIEGRPYRFVVQSADADGLADPYLTLYDSQGAEVAANDDGGAGLNARIDFVTQTGGTYFAAVSAYGGEGTGRYMLQIMDTDVPGTLYTDETLDAGDDARMSRIEMPGDLDRYRVVLEEGVRYLIDVRGDGEHRLADPFLTVLDGEGQTVSSDDDGGNGLDARLRFTPAQPGEYFIQASGLGGSTGGYQISIVRQ
ncbi:MAG: PPC domain-containing protein [Vitreimonas sp.]